MRFVWYPMGVRKLADAPIATMRPNAMGGAPKLDAVAREMGSMSTAAALLVIISVRMFVRR
jgi:hypothetical protein